MAATVWHSELRACIWHQVLPKWVKWRIHTYARFCWQTNFDVCGTLKCANYVHLFLLFLFSLFFFGIEVLLHCFFCCSVCVHVHEALSLHMRVLCVFMFMRYSVYNSRNDTEKCHCNSRLVVVFLFHENFNEEINGRTLSYMETGLFVIGILQVYF